MLNFRYFHYKESALFAYRKNLQVILKNAVLIILEDSQQIMVIVYHKGFWFSEILRYIYFNLEQR